MPSRTKIRGCSVGSEQPRFSPGRVCNRKSRFVGGSDDNGNVAISGTDLINDGVNIIVFAHDCNGLAAAISARGDRGHEDA